MFSFGICLLDFLWTFALRTWLVHPAPNKAVGEVCILVKHVSLLNKKVCGKEHRRGTWSSLLPAGAIGEKVVSLECYQAMGLTEAVLEIGFVLIVSVIAFGCARRHESSYGWTRSTRRRSKPHHLGCVRI